MESISLNLSEETNHPTLPHTDESLHAVADTVGQLMEFWGFKHLMGRLWTTLYMSPKPLSAPELADRLCVSAGAVSMTLKDLLAWGAICKVCPPDSRKDHYLAEHNLWKLICRVLNEREGRRVELARAKIEEALNQLQQNKTQKKISAGTVESAPEALAFRIKRLQELQKFAVRGDKILKILLRQARVDIRPLQHLFDERNVS